MERYIFLDIDGVLNTQRYYRQRQEQLLPTRDPLGPFFDPKSVRHLAHIVAETGADIVITSSWKLLGEEVMQQLWHERQMPGFVLGVTPDVTINSYCLRGLEILQWLATHSPEDPTDFRYVIIDDSKDFLPEQMDFLLLTNPETGITADLAEVAIKMLK